MAGHGVSYESETIDPGFLQLKAGGVLLEPGSLIDNDVYDVPPPPLDVPSYEIPGRRDVTRSKSSQKIAQAAANDS